ncbi:helix-turn-helix transcriptional regulator [Paracoccus aminophilus]|uniref:Transcriptional activator protein n=1 Tax=Paracoccus aminophilus JCM 7686 TaxID=1367847 RepID=S5Y4G1_PARAH|nr:helix-turn-helix transcriptional regulator [Paracoccus aminophilus]AGT10620.1 transcriptional activator protein [Paracoccus aminophilus JCM 7686]
MLLDTADFGDRLLSLVTAALPLDGCCFYRVENGCHAVNHRLSELSPYWLEKYRSYFWQFDPLHPARMTCASIRVQALDRSAGPVSPGEREYLAGFLAPQRTLHQAELYFRQGAEIVAGASLLRNADQGGFSAENIRLLEALVDFSGFGTAEKRVQALAGSTLSPREREIAVLLGRALSNKEIARHFGIALPTVKTHVSRILEKTGTQSRAEFIRRFPDDGAGLG